MANDNKPTLEYELNDNVVAKLRNLIGGGEGGNPFVTLQEFNTAINGKHIDVTKLKELFASKAPDTYENAYHLYISNVLKANTSGFNALGGIDITFSGSDAISVINMYKNDIEAVTLTSVDSAITTATVNGQDFTFDVQANNYLVLFLVVTVSGEEGDVNTIYPLTLDEISTFLVASE